MKRKITGAFIPFLLTFALLTGCSLPKTPPKAAPNSPSNTVADDEKKHTENKNESTPPAAPNTDTEEENPPETESNSLPFEELASMEKAIDSLMLCSQETGLSYDSKNPLYFWCSIFYGIINYTEEIPQAKETANGIRLPHMAVREFAAGLFSDYTDLPKIPEEFPWVTYEADRDTYLFTDIDRGDIYTKLLNTFTDKEKNLLVSAALYNKETNAPICCYEFTLAENPYAKEISEPMFSYSIAAMTPSDSIITSTDTPTLIGTYQGFSDNHTAEFIIDGNYNAFQVYDTTILSILSSLEADTEITFAVETDKVTEMRTIIHIISK